MKVSVVSYQLAGFNLNINVMHVTFDKSQFFFKKNILNWEPSSLRPSFFNPLSANSAKWSNTLKQFVGKFPPNCLSV